MSADLAVQKALRARLVATPAVTALVPAGGILDRNSRPAPRPSIVIGETQVVDNGRLDRKTSRIFATLHIWKTETSTEGAKQIAGAVRAAVHAGRLDLDDGFQCGDLHVSSQRFLRDPDGETSHGVMTIEALVSEA